jgi:hypothetical protein
MKDAEIIQKINLLGGIEKNKKKKIVTAQKSGINFLSKDILSKLPETYVFLCKNYGSFSFKNLVCVNGIERTPVSDTEGKVSVDDFYDCINSYDEVSELLKKYDEQLTKKVLPIFDGEPGDLICLSLLDNDFGLIYYWHHESNIVKDTYLISKSFDDFFMQLQKEEEKNGDTNSGKITKVSLSQKFLDRLKKDGHGPKNNVLD